MLKIENLHAEIDGKQILNGLTLEVAAGEIHAIMGPNGAGKSTLVKMVYGLVKPDSGEMMLHGAPFTPPDPRAARAAAIPRAATAGCR